MTIESDQQEWEEKQLEGDPVDDDEDDDDDGDDDDDDEDEEDLIDPQDEIRNNCAAKPDCAAYNLKLETCNDRVNSRTKTEEECTEELFDFLHCRDSCVSKVLFSKLK